MPSSSEVTNDDYPKYIGYSNTVKTNKVANDYKWFATIDSHASDKSNPHAVTAEQVNAYTKTVTFTKTEIQDLLSDAIAQSKLDANPVGSIITTISNTNPSTYLGGTWERFAQGRTLVGVDESDSVTLMQTANKMGGSTNPITEHRHDFGKVGSQQTYTYAWGTGNYATGQVYAIGSQVASGSAPNNNLLTRQHADLGGTTNLGNNTDHNNWQPFATVYFWQRTA
ncbi:MAG: phage baseplate protein [Pseudolactococcus laudensis]